MDNGLTLEERFWSRVNKNGPNGCWEWTAYISPRGYGRYATWKEHHPQSSYMVHRIAYELLVGPIPEGLEIDHLCRNRRCVNPAHLEPVTTRTNILRGMAPSAIHAKKQRCPKCNSEYGSYVTKRGNIRRKCYKCSTISTKEWQRNHTAKGLCRRCGKCPLSPASNSYCEVCRIKQNTSRKLYRRRKKAINKAKQMLLEAAQHRKAA